MESCIETLATILSLFSLGILLYTTIWALPPARPLQPPSRAHRTIDTLPHSPKPTPIPMITILILLLEGTYTTLCQSSTTRLPTPPTRSTPLTARLRIPTLPLSIYTTHSILSIIIHCREKLYSIIIIIGMKIDCNTNIN